MGYNKLVSAGGEVELYSYERQPIYAKRRRRVPLRSLQQGVFTFGKNTSAETKPAKVRRKEDVRRAVLAFRRLVAANCGQSANPVFITLTYAENMADVGRGRKDFTAFARRCVRAFGSCFRFISVPEFQQRGAVHFHALLWGVAEDYVDTERHTRFFASLWRCGFVDLVKTDGSIKLASYMSKYLGKAYADARMVRKRAYTASRNVLRPYVDRDAILAPYFFGDHQVDLSTAELLTRCEYDTVWLGRAIYRRYRIKSYASQS